MREEDTMIYQTLFYVGLIGWPLWVAQRGRL